MKTLVTGSSGHLGEALMRRLPGLGHDTVGLDCASGPYTTHEGSITDHDAVSLAMQDVEAVLHTATLHKPHVDSQSRQRFVDVNIAGTLTLLEAAAAAGVRRFVFTSTTSAFGDALRPGPDAPAVWIDERVPPVPKNIYGATKTAAEDLCALFARNAGLENVVLRTSRFFPEDDDDAATRAAFAPENAKANEFLHRRLDLEDAVSAHVAAMTAPLESRFSRFIISAPTRLRAEDLGALRQDPAAVIEARFPGATGIYDAVGWRMPTSLDRVYDSRAAQAALGWRPVWDFGRVLAQVSRGERIGSDLGREIGVKGYRGSSYGADLLGVDAQAPARDG